MASSVAKMRAWPALFSQCPSSKCVFFGLVFCGDGELLGRGWCCRRSLCRQGSPRRSPCTQLRPRTTNHLAAASFTRPALFVSHAHGLLRCVCQRCFAVSLNSCLSRCAVAAIPDCLWRHLPSPRSPSKKNQKHTRQCVWLPICFINVFSAMLIRSMTAC